MEYYFWKFELSINREIDKVEAILDSSLKDFNQSVKNKAIPLMYQHDNKNYYDDNPDDGVEVLHKEICIYKEEQQWPSEEPGEEPSEQPREEPIDKEAKQQWTKQQNNNNEVNNDVNNEVNNEANNEVNKRDTQMRPYGAKTIKIQ